MSLPPLDYPFLFDGVSYYSNLADAFNEDTLAAGLRKTWSFDQAPLYLSVQFLILKGLGFSYLTALWVQATLVVLLCGLILFSLYRNFQPAKLSDRRGFTWIFLLVSIGLLAASGFLYVLPGNLFDFRLDLVASLFLTLALVNLGQRHWSCSLYVALAICERFHNLPALIWTILILIIGSGFGPLSKFKFKQFLAQTWHQIKFPLLGLIVVFLFRSSNLFRLARYYLEGHFGLEKQLRGFGDWQNWDYFTYYPKSLLHDYLNNSAYGFLIVFLGAIWLFYQNRQKPSERRHWLTPLLPCGVGAVIVFALLVVNPTRNNVGILRYALLPGVIFLIGVLANLVYEAKNYLRQVQRVLLGALLIATCWSTLAMFLALNNFYQTFDYWGMRELHLVEQVDAMYTKMYQNAVQKPHPLGISVASTFNHDLNFHPGQWQIFLASHGLKRIPYQYPFGTQFYALNFTQENLPSLDKVDYLAMATEGCRVPSIPFNQTINENWEAIAAVAQRRCPISIAQVKLKGCEINMLQCGT